MRVAINLLYMLPGIVGGTETYAAGLLHGLARIGAGHEFHVFLNEESAQWPLPGVANFIRVVCRVKARDRMRRYAFEQFRLPRLLEEHLVDVVHSLGYVSPLRTRCPKIVTIPDLNYRALGKDMRRLRRLTLEFFVRQSAKRSQRVIAISQYARHEIAETFRLPLKAIALTYLASRFDIPGMGGAEPENFALVQERLGIIRPYMVAFSGVTRNKNIERLINAFGKVKTANDLAHQLVLIGHEPESGSCVSRSLENSIVFTGYLDEKLAKNVLSHGELFVFPSYYEGFGLPIIEAMGMGVPVVCSNAACLPEIAGDAALYFDPYCVEDMAGKIECAMRDRRVRDELREKGMRNVLRFSWMETAKRTMGVYAEVLNGGML